MKTRLILSAGLVAIAAASQATVTFAVKTATTNGASGLQSFTPAISANTIVGNVNRTAPATPVTLNFDLKAMTNVGYLTSITFDLYFVPSAAGKMQGAFTFNPVGVGPGGTDADLAGGVYNLTSGGAFQSITSLGTAVTVGGVNYTKVSRTISLAGLTHAPKWHLVLDDQFKNAKLAMVDTTVQAVPEPASVAALGLGALGLLRRRRKA